MSTADIFAESGYDDLLLPFQLDSFDLRGRMVRLNSAAHIILDRHGYPDPVAKLLGEVMVISVCLAGALKFEGVFLSRSRRRACPHHGRRFHQRGAFARLCRFRRRGRKTGSENGEATVPG